MLTCEFQPVHAEMKASGMVSLLTAVEARRKSAKDESP
jgi:hypothetical protein